MVSTGSGQSTGVQPEDPVGSESLVSASRPSLLSAPLCSFISHQVKDRTREEEEESTFLLSELRACPVSCL